MRVIGPAGASLPVELARFTAAADGHAAVLTWQTASETNNDGFHIEHRAPGHQRFRETVFIRGRGTTTAPQSYSQRIEGLSPGSHRFRLRQVDTDGTADYSDEVRVEIGLTDAFVLSGAAPNPARQQSVVRLTVREAQEVRVAVYDALGRQVALLHNGPLASGTAHPFALDGAALPSGVYFVRAVGERFSGVQRVALVK